MAEFVKWFALGLSAFGLGSAGVALAASGLHHEPGDGAWTEISGVEGVRKTELFTGTEYFAIQALKVWDFDRRLCSVQLEQGALNAQGTRSTVLEAVKLCEPKQSEAWKRADLGNGQFVTAVAACVAKSKDASRQLHGVELWGAALDAEGKLKPAPKSVRAGFHECEKWLPKRACPAGSVATGVRAYSDDADSGAIGLSLRCHKLTR
jgi:hypothetical protein